MTFKDRGMGMEIRSNTFMISTQFWGRELNLFLVRGERLLLIDSGVAGMPPDLILPYMAEHGLAAQDLSLLANTHAHADHMGGNAEIQAVCSAKIGAHELDVPWIEKHELHCLEHYDRHGEMGLFPQEMRQRILDVCGCDSPVDLVWQGGETLDLGGRQVEVIHAPGHSRGNLVLLDREEGILFEGETILGSASGEAGERRVAYYFDVASYRNTLRHLAELPWSLLLSSHAQPRDREAGLREIGESLDFVDRFGGQVGAVLAGQGEPLPFPSVVAGMSREYGYALNFGLALLVDTHLDYESRTHRATKTPDGRWAWTGRGSELEDRA
jgi:glyoxylase-like metal-dependent hydrolase (beta-lactamase superfamily II)